MPLPAAVLDIDGTLVDTNYHHALCWYEALRQHDVHLPLFRIHRAIGMGGDQLVAAVAGEDVEREQGDDIRTAETALYMATIATVEDPCAAQFAVQRNSRSAQGSARRSILQFRSWIYSRWSDPEKQAILPF